MRIRKSLLILLLLSFTLTGCYTQLEYSQKVSRITDEKPVEGYAWSDEAEKKETEEERANLTVADSIYIAETYGAKVSPYTEPEDEEYYYEEDYIPIEYKDYSVIDQYEACGCNPYKTYIIYDSYYPTSSWYFGSNYYYSSRYHYYNWRPYYGYASPFYRWHWNYHLGFNYYHRGFGLAFYWGSPYYYDPFFYDPFYYGFHRPIYYNNYYFGTYAGTVRSNKTNRRYGRRSVGADRVRSRDATLRNRSGVTRNNTATRTVRSRSIGTKRSRGTVRSSGGTTVRSRGATRVGRSQSGSRTRSRGTIKRSRDNNRNDLRSRTRGSRVDRDDNDRQRAVSRSGLRYPRNSVVLSPQRRAEIEAKLRTQRAKQINRSARNSSRKSFFGRLGNIFNNGRSIRSNSSSRNRSFNFGDRSRSRSKVGRSRSSSGSSRSSVTRSRSKSKSSPSRSRGSSSSKRSRDRGNN